jgi:biotin synthase
MEPILRGYEEILQATTWPLDELFLRAGALRAQAKGQGVRLRAIIEFSNHCVRNCRYCGLRRGNPQVKRYRMTPEQILDVALQAAQDGIGTVVLQSGDDLDYAAGDIAELIRAIKEKTSLAVTLSLGERAPEEYALWRQAGADRYLMKHETADPLLYDALHPGKTLDERLRALRLIKQLGYELGSGFIIGLPGQTLETLAADVALAQELGVDMCGVGPFVPQAETPLADHPRGDVDTTLRMIALLRLACPDANLPATTALASLDPEHGQRRALEAGANVIMPNFTPDVFRENYRIYDHKAAVNLDAAKDAIRAAGRELVIDGGMKSL